VDTAGRIYITGPSGFVSHLPGSASPLWRSVDGGATFVMTPPGLRASLPGGGDSDVAIDPGDGRLFITDLWLGSDTVSTSSDGGQTWIANPLSGIVVEDRQWLAAAGNDVAYHVTHQIPAGLVVSRSVLSGVIYPISTVAATPVDQTGCICPPGNLIAEGGGGGLLGLGLADKVGVIYSTSGGGVKFAHSTNSALTFTNTDVKPASADTTNSNFPVVANAGAGKLVAVWLAQGGASDRVEESSSPDWGSTWSAPRVIVNTGTSVYPWVAAKGSRVSVSLYHTSASGTPDTVAPSSRWFESYLESTDGGASFGALQTVDPTPAKTGIICTGGINCTTGRQLGDFQTVAMDPGGHANMSWNRLQSDGSVLVMFAKTNP
ncbi:MAG: hypothetical protein LC749_06295, partial [Actinobacteria bacterium]|nr:hypothetical protein [Actinomycetota bacterium]